MVGAALSHGVEAVLPRPVAATGGRGSLLKTKASETASVPSAVTPTATPLALQKRVVEVPQVPSGELQATATTSQVKSQGQSATEAQGMGRKVQTLHGRGVQTGSALPVTEHSLLREGRQSRPSAQSLSWVQLRSRKTQVWVCFGGSGAGSGQPTHDVWNTVCSHVRYPGQSTSVEQAIRSTMQSFSTAGGAQGGQLAPAQSRQVPLTSRDSQCSPTPQLPSAAHGRALAGAGTSQIPANQAPDTRKRTTFVMRDARTEGGEPGAVSGPCERGRAESDAWAARRERMLRKQASAVPPLRGPSQARFARKRARSGRVPRHTTRHWGPPRSSLLRCTFPTATCLSNAMSLNLYANRRRTGAVRNC